MFNTALITPRNVIVIGVISVLTHILAKPLYNAVGKKA